MSSTIAAPKGRYRTQFTLTCRDLDRLRQLQASQDASSLARAAGRCLRRQADRAERTLPEPHSRWYRRLAGACRLPRNARGKAEPVTVWSQWVVPEDQVNLERLMRALDLRSKSQALRLAIRAEYITRSEHAEPERPVPAGDSPGTD